jgi:diguanylate cyclase (GGDEF)-like protein
MSGANGAQTMNLDRISFLEKQVTSLQGGLQYLVTHDPLTGCWNRAAILDTLRREMARVKRQTTDFGLILIGADLLKTINYGQGEGIGDSVLRAISRKIRPNLRPYDFLGRYADNEFLIVAPGCNLMNAVAVAERIRRLFADKPTDVTQEITTDELHQLPDSKVIPVSLSLGVYASDTVRDPDLLLHIVQAAFYRAKSEGGNRVIVGTITEPGPAKALPEQAFNISFPAGRSV